MKTLVLVISIALASLHSTAASVIPSEIRVNNRVAEWEIYNDAWLVKREDNDHITYKRRTSDPQNGQSQLPTTVTTTEKPCTTPIPSTEAPTTTTQRARTTESDRRVNLGARRSDSSSSSGGRSLQPKSIPRQTTTQVSPGEGNYWWMVSHRTDNRITYTRRSNSTETTTEQPNPGQLRRLGHGQDSVVARVVNVGGDDLGTEEEVLSRGRKAHAERKSAKSNSRRNQQPVQQVVQENQNSEDKESYPRIGEEHNGWRVVGKTKDQISWERVKEEGEIDLAAESRQSLGLKSSVDAENHSEGNVQYISHNINDDDDVDDDVDSPPRVGDIENGWRVIKKRKNHITWEKVEVGSAGLISRTLTSGENRLTSGGNRLKSGESRLQSGESRLQSGDAQSQSKTTSQFSVHEVESYPRVGEVVEGWRVMSKSNDHISWAKVGTENETVSSSDAQENQNKRPSNLQLRSGDRVHYRNSEGAERVFPRTRGDGVASDSFPNEFETYSRATNPNLPRDTVIGGTVRTSNSTSWNVGDELHGWKVIGKDYRGIIWEKLKNDTETSSEAPPATARPRLQVKSGDNIRRGGSQRASSLNQVVNGDFVRYLHPDGQERLYPKSRDNNLNNLQINSNLEGSNIGNKNKTDTENKKPTVDPKRIGWYLAKESRNSITWQKDDVDVNAVYNHNEFPQVGHEQSGWKVSNKTRHHISWRRVGTDHLDSDEEIPSR